MKSVLYVGCPASERLETERILADASVAVVWAENLSYALAELQRRELPVLLDLSRGAAALQTARELRAHRASTLMLEVAGVRQPDLTAEAVLAGMAGVFSRPLGGRRVANAIDRERRYEARETLPPSNVDDLYTHSAAMRDVMALVARASTMRAGVLIRGERGTGRQAAARAIHAAQNGSGGPFVAVDCGACDGDELNRQLFGTAGVNGADPLARGLERVSRFSRLYEATGGTLYLQNIAEAPAKVQSRLARVLRDREAVLAENDVAVGLDVRPIAAADPGFENAVQDGRVRDDLFRRVSVIRIDMPPLRGRREDIPALAN